MSTPAERANNEITRILNHTGLNSGDTARVHTDVQAGELVSTVSGVDLRRAQAALNEFLSGRPDVQIWPTTDVLGDYLIVTQPVRE